MTGTGPKFMTVEFRVMLPADVTALARLSREIDAAIKRTGLSCSPPVVRGTDPEETP